MKRIRNILSGGFLIIFGCMLGSISISANENEEPISIIDESGQKEAEQVVQDIKKLEQEVSSVDKQIQFIEKEIEDVNKQIVIIDEEINEKEKELASREVEKNNLDSQILSAKTEMERLKAESENANEQIQKGVAGFWETLDNPEVEEAIALFDEYKQYLVTDHRYLLSSTTLQMHKLALDTLVPGLEWCRQEELNDPAVTLDRSYGELPEVRPNLHVSIKEFAISMLNADSQYSIRYGHNYVTGGSGGECLSNKWGTYGPFGAWYAEKATYRKVKDDIENSGLTHYANQIGHYMQTITNISALKRATVVLSVIGDGYKNKLVWDKELGNFKPEYEERWEMRIGVELNQYAFKYDTYYNLFMAYYNNLLSAEERYNKAKENYENLLLQQKDKNDQIDSISDELDLINDTKKSVTKKLNDLTDKLKAVKAQKSDYEAATVDKKKQLQKYMAYYRCDITTTYSSNGDITRNAYDFDWDYSGIASSRFDHKTYAYKNGIINLKENGVFFSGVNYVLIENGKISNFTGLAQDQNDVMYYFTDGVHNKTFNGLSKTKNSNDLFAVKNGELDTTFTGVLKNSDKLYFVNKGKVNTSYTGISPKGNDGNYYFLRNGIVDQRFTGIAKSIVDNQWYFVRKGILDGKFTGVAQSVADNNWYHCKNGKLDWNFTGISQSIANGKWYFSRKGKLDWNFTGIAKSVANNQWYFTRKGELDWKFTGVAQSVADNNWYHCKNGKLDWNFTGISQSVANGKWYFSRKGKLDWKFTGIAQSIANNQWYFVRNGQLDWNYTGGAKSIVNGKWYSVRRGLLNWNFNGKLLGLDGKYRMYVRGFSR